MNKAKNEKLYTITVNNAKFTNPSVQTCFAKFLNSEITDRNLPEKLHNLLYCLQDLGLQCTSHTTKIKIKKVCDVIELLNPLLDKELLSYSSIKNIATLRFIMRDYILNLTNSLSDDMVIDMLNEFVTLDTIDFEVNS